MTSVSGTQPIAATAHGMLAQTPLAHVLVYIRNKCLSGTLELFASQFDRDVRALRDRREARLEFWRGRVVTAITRPVVVARFGSVVYEMSMISAATLDDATVTSIRERTPIADVLLAAKAITSKQRDEVLAEQIRRRVHYTFTFPPETQFVFREDTTDDEDEPLLSVDVLAPVWRGIVDFPPETQMASVLERIGDFPLVMVQDLDHVDLGEFESERALCDALTRGPLTLREAHERFLSPSARVDQLFYLLAIAKCIAAAEPAASVEQPKKAPPAISISHEMAAATTTTTSSSVAASSTRAVIVGPEEFGVEGIRIRVQNLAFETRYEALGLRPNASIDAVRAAYFRLTRLWHPDRLPVGLEDAETEAALIFQHIAAAYRAVVTEHEQNMNNKEATPMTTHAGVSPTATKAS